MEQVSGKLFRGAAWLTATRLIFNGLTVISTFVLARLLAPADFGTVAIATSILAVATAVTDLSLTSALVQREELEDHHFHSVFSISVLRTAAIFVVIALSAYPFALLYHEPRLTAVLIVTAVAAALPGLVSPRMALLTRKLVFWQDFSVQTTQRLLVFIVSIACAVAFRSYWALVVGNLVGAFSSVILSYVIAPYRPRFGLASFRELLSFSLWLSLGNMITTLNMKFDQLVLGYLVGKGPLGLYTVADNVGGLPVRESTAPLTNALFPAFSRINNDPARLRRAYRRSSVIICAVALPVGCGFSLIADPLVRLFLGPKWLGTIPIIEILSATFAFQAFSMGLQPIAMARGATKILFWRDVRTFLIRIPLLIGGFWWAGLYGVVVGRAISSAIGTIWNMALIRDLVDMSIVEQFRIHWRSTVATLTMVATTFLFAWAARVDMRFSLLGVIAIEALIGAVAYVAMTVLLWIAARRPDGPEREIWNILRPRIMAR